MSKKNKSLDIYDYFKIYDNDEIIKDFVGSSAKEIFPAVKEKSLKGDYDLFTFPNYKDALERMQNDNFNPYFVPHRDQFVEYTNQFLSEIGIYKEDIIQELEPYYADKDLIDIQSEIDEEKIRLRSIPKFHGAMYRLDDRRLTELNKAKFFFTKKYLGKITGLWKTKILEEKEVHVPIRVFTIHTPKVSGSKCKYIETKNNSELISYGISIFGIGSNLHKVVGIKNQNSYTANDGRCYEILKRATFVVEKRVEIFKGKKQCDPYIEVYLKDLDKGYEKKSLTSDECESLQTNGEYYEGYNLSKAIDPDTCSLEISKFETRNFNIDLGFLFNTKIGVKAESISNTTKKFSYTLPGGYSYKIFKPQNSFGYVWDVN